MYKRQGQKFYDPRRAMALRAWMDGDIRLAIRLLQWANPKVESPNKLLDDNINEYEAA